MNSPRPAKAKTKSKRDPKQIKDLEKLHKVGLVPGLTADMVRSMVPEVEAAATKALERGEFGDEDVDPRNYEDRWLEHVFYLHLMNAGAAEGVLTSNTSLTDLTALLATNGPASIVFEQPEATQGGLKVRASFPFTQKASLEILWTSPVALAGLANFALREIRDRRVFVRCQTDPRFALSGFEGLYWLVNPEQLRTLVKLGIVRNDDESDVVESVSRPPTPYLDVRGITAEQTSATQQNSVLAMPQGGDWFIQGTFRQAPQGPVATNLSGSAYAKLYEVRGWRPSANPTANTFSAKWDLQPGVLLALLDGGDDASRAGELVQSALNDLKQAAETLHNRPEIDAIQIPEAALVTAQIRNMDLFVQRRGAVFARLIRNGEMSELVETKIMLEPGDVVIFGTDVADVAMGDEIVAIAAASDDAWRLEKLLRRAAKHGAVRPSLLIVRVALRPAS